MENMEMSPILHYHIDNSNHQLQIGCFIVFYTVLQETLQQ